MGRSPRPRWGDFHPPGLISPLLNPKYAITAFIRYVDCMLVNLINIINLYMGPCALYDHLWHLNRTVGLQLLKSCFPDC